ncbi:uncharacterized protein B0H18DRAFT_218517 [Fomitopsis serialis]|uniref:uncharacterized protein n=1 Tax=Fomitopsis serialis TaxID=139415 RepID=UPI00200890D1|nr:uncharacterized protein B0H18DRAFT_218517 [Neoantrodia serialis]KAH9913018.1 hypothetical protein B0H18DRAFT_218517 [Neoantrodia serialis]
MSGSPLRSTTPSKSELSPACDDNDPSPIDSEHRGASAEALEEQESDDKRPSPQFLLDPLELFEVKPMQHDFAHECVHIRSWNIDSDDVDDDGDVSPWFYAICGSELKDDLNNHMIMALQCQDADLADRITGMYQPSAVILSFNLEAPSNADSDSRHSDAPELREHLLACATSPSPIAAYIYYLGFLEHVFRKVLKLAEWSKETSDAECDLQDISCAEIEGREPEHELDGVSLKRIPAQFPRTVGSSQNSLRVMATSRSQKMWHTRRTGDLDPCYLCTCDTQTRECTNARSGFSWSGRPNGNSVGIT